MFVFPATETNRRKCLILNSLDYSIHQDFRASMICLLYR
ncbi:hypothetical protein V6Z12_A08G129100 [Gossypium hirsutum]